LGLTSVVKLMSNAKAGAATSQLPRSTAASTCPKQCSAALTAAACKQSQDGQMIDDFTLSLKSSGSAIK
jgi:hypothetical protein